MSYAQSWGEILTKHVQFRCKVCPDGSGGFADVACADAWYGDERGYPSFEEERRILDTMAFTRPNLDVERVIELDDILNTRKVVDSIHVDEKVRDYIVHVVFATRDPHAFASSRHDLTRLSALP